MTLMKNSIHYSRRCNRSNIRRLFGLAVVVAAYLCTDSGAVTVANAQEPLQLYQYREPVDRSASPPVGATPQAPQSTASSAPAPRTVPAPAPAPTVLAPAPAPASAPSLTLSSSGVPPGLFEEPQPAPETPRITGPDVRLEGRPPRPERTLFLEQPTSQAPSQNPGLTPSQGNAAPTGEAARSLDLILGGNGASGRSIGTIEETAPGRRAILSPSAGTSASAVDEPGDEDLSDRGQRTVLETRADSDTLFRTLFGAPEQTGLGQNEANLSPDDRSAEQQTDFRSRLMPTPSTTGAGHMFSSRDAATFFAWLPPNRRSGSATLVFAMRNSADALPGASEVEVLINGESLAEVGTTADGRERRIELSVPDRFLLDGNNSIEFRSLLYHRVACTIQSGYETWVEVPAETAWIGYDLENGLDQTAVLGWIGQAMQGQALPIYSVGREPQDTVIRAGFSFAQGVAVSSGLEAHPVISRPVADIQSDASSRVTSEFPGVDLDRISGPIAVIMGVASDLRGIVATGLLGQINGPHLSTHRVGDRIIILVSGLSGGDVAYAAHGFAQEVANNQPAWRYYTNIRSNMSRDWATLGARTESAFGPMYRSRVAVNLPSDSSSMEEQSARLYLNLAYGAGLAPGAEILVMVNGRTAAAYALSDAEGEILENRGVDVPMRFFRPGANLIELEARLPYVEDERCFWRGGPPSQNRPRMTLFDDTYIQFPDFGEITLLPDLRLFTEEMLPYRNQGRMPVILTDGDHDTVSAAWSFMGGLAARSGAVLPVDLRVGTAPAVSESMLVFGLAPSLPEIVREKATVDLSAVLQAWEDRRYPGAVRGLDGAPGSDGIRDNDRVRDTDRVVEDLRRLQVSDTDTTARDRSEATGGNLELGDAFSVGMIDSRSTGVGRTFTNGDSSVIGGADNAVFRQVDATTLERADWRDRLSIDRDSSVGFFVGWIQAFSNALISEAYTDTPDYRMPVWAETDSRDQTGSRSTDFVISQFSPRGWLELLPGFSTPTWTVVSAPTTEGLWSGVERLRRIDSINGVGGDTALFNLTDGSITLRKSTTDYVSTGQNGFTFTGLRSMFGQWFSLNLWVWVGFVILVVIFVGLLTNVLLRSFGQREDFR